MSRRDTSNHGTAGMTLAELIVAAGLASIVMLAVLRLVEASTSLWTKGERRRALVEQAATTAELVARDLRALHSGSTGDLVVDWYPHDVERDGIAERVWPRLRFVRSAAPVDVARIRGRAAADAARAARAARDEDALGALELAELAGSTDPDADPTTLPAVDITSSGLIEVAWCLVPAALQGEGRYEGLLLRAERLLEPGQPSVVLAADFFDRQGRPPIEAVEEITGGVLWFDVRLATQTTALDGAKADGGWGTGRAITDAASSWDAWNLGRPDPELHAWNEPAPGMPRARTEPLLPRRVRVELEIERAVDRDRRTRLAAPVEEEEVRVLVESTRDLEALVGRHVLVAGEWLRVRSVSSDAFVAERAERGTTRRRLPAGALVHFGEPLVVEVPVPLHRDDWTLDDGGVR